MESWGRGGAGARARAGSQRAPQPLRRGSRDRVPQQAQCECHGPRLSPSTTWTAPSRVPFALGRRLSWHQQGSLGKHKWTALRGRREPEGPCPHHALSLQSRYHGPLATLPVATSQALPSSPWNSITPPSYPSPHSPTCPITWGRRIGFLTRIPLGVFLGCPPQPDPLGIR